MEKAIELIEKRIEALKLGEHPNKNSQIVESIILELNQLREDIEIAYPHY